MSNELWTYRLTYADGTVCVGCDRFATDGYKTQTFDLDRARREAAKYMVGGDLIGVDVVRVSLTVEADDE